MANNIYVCIVSSFKTIGNNPFNIWKYLLSNVRVRPIRYNSIHLLILLLLVFDRNICHHFVSLKKQAPFSMPIRPHARVFSQSPANVTAIMMIIIIIIIIIIIVHFWQGTLRPKRSSRFVKKEGTIIQNGCIKWGTHAECFPKHLRMGTERMKYEKETDEEGKKRCVSM